MSFWEELTLETNTVRQREEFIKKYRHSFVWVHLPDKAPVLARLEGYSEESRLYSFTTKGKLIRLVHDTEAKITAGFPSPKLINYEKTFIWFSRVPARQYRKGVSNENVNFFSPVHSYWGHSCNFFEEESVAEAFHPTYYDFDVAMEMLEHDVKGVAINSNFAVSLHPTTDTAKLLWYRFTPIATIEDNQIKLIQELLRQEVLDFVKNNNVNLRIA